MNTNTLSPEAAAAYQAAIKTQFAALKQINQFDELVARSIRLESHKGYLLCVSELHADDDKVIAMLTKWRREAVTFRDSFKPTFDSTKRWLRKLVLDVPDRILFFVLDRHGNAVGHLGFAHAMNDQGLMEVDNVIRGVKDVEPGIMSLSTQALLRWAVQTFSPQGFHLETLEDNTHAIDFYIRLGFKVGEKLPLRCIEKEGMVNLVPLTEDDKNSPDNYIVCMNYAPMTSTDDIVKGPRLRV